MTDFLSSCEHIVGKENIETGEQVLPYMQNVTGFERRLGAVISPSTREDVVAIVKLANKHNVPLYPVSCGRNWGYGSFLPVTDDCVIVNLRKMNRIREVDSALGYAVIEPGVTQEQLYLHLKNLNIPFYIDVTGAGKETSIIGNGLERGFTHDDHRIECLSAFEVVLGTGEVLKTGFGHYENSKITNIFKWGIGPSLDGLFSQSNFGIVTSATINLKPVSESHMPFMINVTRNYIPLLIEGLRTLMLEGTMNAVMRIGNRERHLPVIAPLLFRQYIAIGQKRSPSQIEEMIKSIYKNEWLALGHIYGPAVTIEETRYILTATLSGIANVSFPGISGKVPSYLKHLSPLDLDVFQKALAPMGGLATGVPSDGSMGSLHWHLEQSVPGTLENVDFADPDHSRSGFMFCNSFWPMKGDIADALIDMISSTGKNYGFEPAMTLNTVKGRAIETIITISFDRTSIEQTKKAHECIRALNKVCIQSGYYPFRFSIENMQLPIDEKDVHWKIVKQIKSVFDPNGIISPGRYCPL